MAEYNSETTIMRRPGDLNENQQTRLRVTCRHIDKLLSNIEDILHAATVAHTGATNRISSLELSGCIHNVIEQLVQRSIEQLRTTGNHAIDSLQQIANKLGRTDVPSHGEFQILLRICLASNWLRFQRR
jgi:hypothetical protein